MFCSAFPMITPFFYSELVDKLAIKNNFRVTSSRMLPHYNKRFKKRKR